MTQYNNANVTGGSRHLSGEIPVGEAISDHTPLSFHCPLAKGSLPQLTAEPTQYNVQ